jgi:uncharacterized membrane protein YkoI
MQALKRQTTIRPTSSRLCRRALRWGGLLAGVVALAVTVGPRDIVAVLEATTAVVHATPQQAQTSLAQVVRIAEQQTGGRARKVEMERERGIEVYEIKTVAKDGSATVLIDSASGNVVRVETAGFLASIATIFDRDDQREDHAAFAQLEASAMTLAGAIEAAEKETGGRAIKAALKRQYGATLFEVRVVKDWIPQKVLVDPATAQVVTVPAHGKKPDDD